MKDSLVAEKNFASCLKGKSSTQKSRREFAKLKGVQTWRDLIFMLIMLVESKKSLSIRISQYAKVSKILL